LSSAARGVSSRRASTELTLVDMKTLPSGVAILAYERAAN
jgi:hypothetical protein